VKIAHFEFGDENGDEQILNVTSQILAINSQDLRRYAKVYGLISLANGQ